MALTPFLAELGQKVGKAFDSHDMKARAAVALFADHPSHHSLCCSRRGCPACVSTGYPLQMEHCEPVFCK
jgi:hypothetical protein